MSNFTFFLLLTIGALIIQAFFSMMEMACVSFNRVRLEYYVSKGSKRAIWLSSLLKQPTRLFGTTLLGVNACLQFGSECSRQVYVSIGLSPDWAPISQIVIVLLFAELIPLFTARRFSEHVANLGIGPLYVASKVLFPFSWLFEQLFKCIRYLTGVKPTASSYLSKEELQRAIEDREEKHGFLHSDDFDTMVRNLFSIKSKIIKDIMVPLKFYDCISSTLSNDKISQQIKHYKMGRFFIYEKSPTNITAVAKIRDLTKLSHSSKINLKSISQPAWFVGSESTVFSILNEFKQGHHDAAVVLDQLGSAVGIVTLEHIINEIFVHDVYHNHLPAKPQQTQVVIDRLFAAKSLLIDINEQFQINLAGDHHPETLEDLMTEILGHHPSIDEAVRVDNFELKVEEAPLFGEKLIAVRSL